MNLNQLAEQAARVRRATAEAMQRRLRHAAFSSTGRATADTARTIRFSSQVAAGFWWLWLRSATARHVLVRAVVAGWHSYRWLWDRWVYVTVHGVRVFRTPRAGLMILSTGLFIWFLGLPVLELVLVDAPSYALTAHVNESIYLRGSQELSASDSLHAVKGCRVMPCDDADAIYFRVENDLFSNLWSLSHGRGLFFPEYVAAAVPYETTQCVASSFGFRFRGTVRWLNLFPQLLAVSCDRRG